MFSSRYDPTPVDAWVADAPLLLAPDRASPHDPPKQLTTALLDDLSGGHVVAARQRQGTRWGKDVFLSFRPQYGEPLTFRVSRPQAESFFTAVGQQAHRAKLSRLDDAAYPYRCRTAADGTRSTLLSSPRLEYPRAMLDRGLPGFVLLGFTIDTTGRPIMDESLRVVFASHPVFAAEAIRIVAEARYSPPTRQGEVTTMDACQPVHFSIQYRR